MITLERLHVKPDCLAAAGVEEEAFSLSEQQGKRHVGEPA